MFESLTLDDIVIRSSSHTPFFGVYLASHAITDALCMCHASVGCKVKTQYHLSRHDAAANSYARRRYSQFIDEDLINGSTEQLEQEIRAWHDRQKSGVVVIDGSTPISLQAQSMAGVIERMEKLTGVHVVHVAARNYDEDLYAGYALTIGTLLRRMDFGGGAARRKADEVCIVGNLFDRYEGDSIGNVAELRRMLAALGFRAPAIFFSGEPYAELCRAPEARSFLVMPHGASQLRTLEQLGPTGVDHVKTGLPMGLGGTKAWLRIVGAHLGVADRAEAFITSESARLKNHFEVARRQLGRRRFALFCEGERAAGLLATHIEVGMTPTLVGLLHLSAGGRAAVERELAEHYGITLPPSVRWLENPTPVAVRECDLGGAEVVIGTTIERELLVNEPKPWVEFGYPSELRHFLAPAPYLGFEGALRLLEQTCFALERPHVGGPPEGAQH